MSTESGEDLMGDGFCTGIGAGYQAFHGRGMGRAGPRTDQEEIADRAGVCRTKGSRTC